MLKRLIFLTFCTISLLSSCTEHNVNPKEALDLLPLEEGNQWIYLVTEYDTTSHIIIKQYIDTLKIKNKATWVLPDVVLTYFYFNYFPWFNAYDGEIMAWKVDSLFVVSADNSFFPNMKFKLHPKLGDTLEYSGRLTTVTDVNYKLTTNYGNYNCTVFKSTKVKIYTVSNTFIHYFSEGIGLVKFESYRQKSDQRSLKMDMVLIEKNF